MKNSGLEILHDTLDYIKEIHKPDGINIGMNIGKSAGQTIDHLHIHIIPRYTGDVENPIGGVRGLYQINKNIKFLKGNHKDFLYFFE